MKPPMQIDWSEEKQVEFLKRIESYPIPKEDIEDIKAFVEAVSFLSKILNEKARSIKRLLRMLFGARTERMKNIFNNIFNNSEAGKASEAPPASNQAIGAETDGGSKPGKRKGHGRNGTSDYPGAKRVKVPHPTLRPGDRCPHCPKGKVYPTGFPGVVFRFEARAPIEATVYELDKLRCNCCGEIFTPKMPQEAGEKKYDETVGSMIALLKYGSGFPFHRIERLQQSVGIPLPASTQWEIVESHADQVAPAYHEMIRQAAQGEVIHNDDTTMKILSLMEENEKNESSEENESSRTGIFTTGMLSIVGGHKIALFRTGRNHSGENMAELLSQRSKELPAPIQMCDALSRNCTERFDTILSNCMAHARRYFVEETVNFPEESKHVIETLAKVYKNDETAKVNKFTSKERLEFHKANSGPLMKKLKEWLEEQFSQKKVEPNSGMGKAISYMLSHWESLTRFLEVENAPLDNNVCEQVLKRAILHRKNALFFKTERGARVGDLFMSLIHTCNLALESPFEYLIALQRNFSDLRKNPCLWMPWNYKERLAALKTQ